MELDAEDAEDAAIEAAEWYLGDVFAIDLTWRGTGPDRALGEWYAERVDVQPLDAASCRIVVRRAL